MIYMSLFLIKLINKGIKSKHTLFAYRTTLSWFMRLNLIAIGHRILPSITTFVVHHPFNFRYATIGVVNITFNP